MIEVTRIDDTMFPVSIEINAGVFKFTEMAAVELYKKLGKVICKEQDNSNQVTITIKMKNGYTHYFKEIEYPGGIYYPSIRYQENFVFIKDIEGNEIEIPMYTIDNILIYDKESNTELQSMEDKPRCIHDEVCNKKLPGRICPVDCKRYLIIDDCLRTLAYTSAGCPSPEMSARTCGKDDCIECKIDFSKKNPMPLKLG